ncbi:hypothetical protein BDP81DRAFT_445675 [Colletotrichum phormii]|uniref:Nuclear GTPase SLIP-GC n=1 Tax=Colletotrichum phormii TaxID=359342 RepID=A0AAJ0EN03_9PEZI|nr:uncharacterized protein BDP81DRAFT_445675 [Colletotrichum phormii]KAK1654993.1 hypothetical protein BDP81DRAFT_445675 [Colletotrichum phormii]
MANVSKLIGVPHGSILTNIGDRVRAKEKAREFGLGVLQDIPKLLQPISNPSHKQDVKDWETNLQNLKRTSQSREILVGVQGETGLGKSSLLNELLRSDIVPTSQVEACTAAVCIYGYNHEVGDNKRYRAKIKFKSWATVEAELDGIKEELADPGNQHEAQDDDDADQDGGCTYYNKRNIDIIRAWSGLKEEDVRNLSSIQIMEKGNFNKIRGRGARITSDEKTCEKTISAPNANQFKKILRPFAESVELNSHRTQYWPLVEQVEVYLKAPILRHGIRLVDLPGTQDALSFRAEIAETFQDRLAKQIVVSPASRAGDNKAAADLIFTENDLMRFHLDNKFKADSLCVVITKIDDIQTANAADEFPTEEIIELHHRLRGPPQEESEDEEFDSEAEDYTRVSVKKRGGTKKRKSISGTSRDAKRQKSDSHEDDESMTTRLVETQLEGEQAIEEGESHLTYLCIQERNFKMVQNVVESLLKAAKNHSTSKAIASSIPAVFPISSHAYHKMSNGKDPKGFPTAESTGIPALGNWLTDTSLPIREAWVDSDLHHIQVLFDAVHGWTQDDFNTLPILTTDEKKKVRQAVRDVGDDLKQIINKLKSKIQRHLILMKPLRQKNLVRTAYIRLGENGEDQVERSFNNLKHAVKAWERKNPRGHASSAGKHEKLHWSTYKASIRRHGGLYRTVPKKGAARRTFNWMADVHTSFWRGHHEKWQTAFSRKFPTLKDKVRGTVHLAFEKWIGLLLGDEELPVSFRDMVRKNSYKMENVFLFFTDKILASIDALRLKALRMSKVDVLSKLLQEMKPGFEAALSKTGKGIMKRQSAEISEHVQSVGFAMFGKARDDLEVKLRDEVHQVILATKRYWQEPKDGCGAMMHKEFKRISTRLCANKSKKNDDADEINEETEKKLIDLIGVWRKEWEKVQARLPQAAPLIAFDDHDDDDDTSNEFAKEDELAEATARGEIVFKKEPSEGNE